MKVQGAAQVVASQDSSSSYSLESAVTGHHIYKSAWTPFIGEQLGLVPEGDNDHDIYAVAVVKNDSIVGHMPRSISRVSTYFLRHGGSIECFITGHRRFGNGLEVPCTCVHRESKDDPETYCTVGD